MRKFLTIFLAFILILAPAQAAFASADTSAETETTAESEDSADTSEESDGGSEDTSSSESSGWPTGPDTVSESVYMIEANTGAVLYEKNIDEKRYPASTTKLLTALIALENCSLSETVTFSETAVDLEEGASSIDAVAGEEMSMKDVIYGLLLPSGNDCANAIAEHISGSIDDFADLMNEYLEELGCENSHFTNPSGLYDDDHYTTAYDMALIAQAAFNNSTLVSIISSLSYTIEETNMSEARQLTNSNSMLSSTSQYYNEYVVGGKTGYLYAAGRCLVTLAKNGGMTIITVTLMSSEYTGVFTDTQNLLDYAFGSFDVYVMSESENRFLYSSEDAKVELDNTSQVIMPTTLSVSDLDSEIVYTYDMDLEEFNDASEAAGITSEDGRHLYAVIYYSYAGYSLGYVNVLINDNLEVYSPEFPDITYINVWNVILMAVVLALIFLILFAIARRRPKKKRRRKNKTARPLAAR